MPTRGRGEESLWGESRRARPAGKTGDLESDPKTQKVLDLQQSAGNAAVMGWLGGSKDKGAPAESKELDAGWGDKGAPAESKELDAGWFGDKDKDKDAGGDTKESDAGWFDDKDAAASKELDAGKAKALDSTPVKGWFD